MRHGMNTQLAAQATASLPASADTMQIQVQAQVQVCSRACAGACVPASAFLRGHDEWSRLLAGRRVCTGLRRATDTVPALRAPWPWAAAPARVKFVFLS